MVEISETLVGVQEVCSITCNCILDDTPEQKAIRVMLIDKPPENVWQKAYVMRFRVRKIVRMK